MKTIENTVLNKQSYDIFSTAHEPVMIKKLGFFISLQEVEEITKNQINTGILKGLEDVEEGRVTEYSEDYKDNLKARIREKIAFKN